MVGNAAEIHFGNKIADGRQHASPMVAYIFAGHCKYIPYTGSEHTFHNILSHAALCSEEHVAEHSHQSQNECNQPKCSNLLAEFTLNLILAGKFLVKEMRRQAVSDTHHILRSVQQI